MQSNSTSQFLQYAMNKDGQISIPRSLFVENMTYKVHVRGHNALGESHSTFNFSIWDIGKRLNYTHLLISEAHSHFDHIMISWLFNLILSLSGSGMNFDIPNVHGCV